MPASDRARRARAGGRARRAARRPIVSSSGSGRSCSSPIVGGEGGRVEHDRSTASTPRPRSPEIGRIQLRSSDGVMMIAVMPRRSRATPSTSMSPSGWSPFGHHRREDLHHLLILARAAVGRQAADARTGRGHRHVAVLEQRPRRDRSGDSHAIFDRRLVAPAGVRRALEVEEDPYVGRLLEVELLDLQLALAGAAAPVDAVVRVTRRIRPDAGRVRRRLRRAHRPGRASPR